MKKLFYDEGPLVMTCGAAGAFRIGQPKEVPDEIAAELLRKGRLKEWPGDGAAAGRKAGGAKAEAAAPAGKDE